MKESSKLKGEGKSDSNPNGTSDSSSKKSNQRAKILQDSKNPGPEPSDSRLVNAALRLAKFSGFEYIMGFIVVFNMVVTIIETDASAEDADKSIPWVQGVGWTVLVIFVTELVIRLVAFRRDFWRDPWNIFDFFVVLTDSVFSLAGLVFGEVFPISTLRVFRLCKLARISKVFRVFPELRLMMAGLMGSIRAIFWGVVLLMFIMLVWAILAVQFIHPLNEELARKGLLVDCDRCPRAYMSVFEATLTFWQQIVAGDSWGQATIPLIENYPATVLYFMPLFLSVGMAVLNLILGVVVNVAQGAHDSLQKEMEDQKTIEKMDAQMNLRAMCSDMDVDGSGELTRDEIFEGFRVNEQFREVMQTMELGEEDLLIVWGIVDADKNGSASYNEFVNELYKLHSSDTSFLLAYIKHYIVIIKDKIMQKMDQEADQMMKAEARVEAELQKVETQEQMIMAAQQKEPKRAYSPNRLSESITQEQGYKVEVQPQSPLGPVTPEAKMMTGNGGKLAVQEIKAFGKDDCEDCDRLVIKTKNSDAMLQSLVDYFQKFETEWRESKAKILFEISSLRTTRDLVSLPRLPAGSVPTTPIIDGDHWTAPGGSRGDPLAVPRSDFAVGPPPSSPRGEKKVSVSMNPNAVLRTSP